MEWMIAMAAIGLVGGGLMTWLTVKTAKNKKLSTEARVGGGIGLGLLAGGLFAMGVIGVLGATLFGVLEHSGPWLPVPGGGTTARTTTSNPVGTSTHALSTNSNSNSDSSSSSSNTGNSSSDSNTSSDSNNNSNNSNLSSSAGDDNTVAESGSTPSLGDALADLDDSDDPIVGSDTSSSGDERRGLMGNLR